MLIVVIKMKSIWQKEISIEHKPELKGTHYCDVVVIGAGMAGILCAYQLCNENKKVIVVEANTIGSGQSGKTTAKITSQHGYIYHKLLMTCGKEKAQQYLDANQEAIQQYAQIIEQHKIDCDFKNCSSYLYSMQSIEKLVNEQVALDLLGVKSTIQNECELPLRIKGCLKLEDQAQFNPMKFMKAIAEENRFAIYEHTKIIDIKEQEVISEKGKIVAKDIVFATHYPIIDFPGLYFMRMHQERSYVLALKNVQQLQDMYYCIDEESLSFRSVDDLLLLGGENHRCGENSAGGRYKKLTEIAKSLFPQSQIMTQWSAQDCMTLDQIAYIGHYCDTKKHWYVATGFNKWGMTTSMVAANIITDMIMNRENPYAEVFSPQRLNLVGSASTFWEQTKQSIKSISRSFLYLPEETLNKLPINHGGVISIDNQKVGVYKNSQGQCFIVDVRCPHLGCQLEWNPDELSWDCPCHGSRFDYHGKLIDNPAQEDLYE